MINEKIVIFAGEPSGDLHGSHLLKKLHALLPHVTFSGVGGPKLRNAGLEELIYRMEDFAVMGFIDVFKSLPKLIRQFRELSRKIIQETPRAVVLIDYPDFNLRLAKSLRKQGYRGKIVQYISPSVWAWRSNRIFPMSQNLDLLLTIYPFESHYYAKSFLPVTFVGNPLSEYLATYSYVDHWKERFSISEEHKMIALFPGSRKSELQANLPLQLQAVKLLLKDEKTPRVLAISCSASEYESWLWEQVNRFQLSPIHCVVVIPASLTYELMRDCHVAIAKSGTVTLELALHHRPTVVIYQLSYVNYCIAKYFVRLDLPYYCIVNILMQKEVFPEFFDKNLKPENIYEQLKQLDGETARRQQSIVDCQQLSGLLQGYKASERAANAIVNLMRQ